MCLRIQSNKLRYRIVTKAMLVIFNSVEVLNEITGFAYLIAPMNSTIRTKKYHHSFDHLDYIINLEMRIMLHTVRVLSKLRHFCIKFHVTHTLLTRKVKFFMNPRITTMRFFIVCVLGWIIIQLKRSVLKHQQPKASIKPRNCI